MTNATAKTCLNCEGRCCTTYIVPVTGLDIWRIAQAQRLAPELFVQREPESYATESGFRLRPNGPTYGLALQHQPARHNERPCIFLMQLRDGVKRCGIYTHRPRACQTYPIRMQHDHVAPRDDMLCPGGSWSYLDQEHWRERLEQQEREWREYEQVVHAWNISISAQAAERGFVLAQYLDYLINVYDFFDLLLSEQIDRKDVHHKLTALANGFVEEARLRN